jgi:hypothetical protein
VHALNKEVAIFTMASCWCGARGRPSVVSAGSMHHLLCRKPCLIPSYNGMSVGVEKMEEGEDYSYNSLKMNINPFPQANVTTEEMTNIGTHKQLKVCVKSVLVLHEDCRHLLMV